MGNFTERLRTEVNEQRVMGEPIDGHLITEAADMIDELEATLRTMDAYRSKNRNGLTYDALIPYRHMDIVRSAINKLENM